jgi:acid phosphatase family membrane protein YuiD
MLVGVFDNGVLWWGLAACGVAQLSKLVIELVVHRRWNPRVLVETGGMPSSHSALLTGTTAALGWVQGFEGPLFALAAVLCFVVLYDASGVRRAAGLTAARVNESEAQSAEAADQLAKVRALSDPRAISKEEIVRRETAANAAASRLKLAQASLAQARAQMKQSQVDFDRLTVRAPVAGEVLQLNARPGEFIRPGEGTAPVILGNTRTLHVRVDVDEADAWRFKRGAKAVAYLRGNAAISVPASFVRIEPFVTPKKSLTGASNERVDTRVLQVLFAFDRAALPIFVGQQMDVFIEAAAAVGASAQKPQS